MKKNLKKVLIVCVVLIILSSFLFLSSAEESEKSMTIRVGMENPLDPLLSHEASLFRVFKNIMEKNTNNRITVDLYPSHTLGKADEMFKMAQRGTIEMAWCSMGTLSQFYPISSALTAAPFIFPNTAVAWKVMQGDLFQKDLSNAIFEETGVRVIDYPAIAFTVLTNNKREVRSPKDLKGLRIRSMPMDLHLKIFEALGAKSTVISWGELYGALQTGVVDGQHNPLSSFEAGKLYEVQKYITLTNHFFDINLWIANDEWLKSLSESDRYIFWDAVRTAMTACLGAVQVAEVSEEVGIPFFKEKGTEIYKPTEDELEEFKELATPVFEEYVIEEFGEEGMMWYEKLKKAIEIAEEEVKQGNIW